MQRSVTPRPLTIGELAMHYGAIFSHLAKAMGEIIPVQEHMKAADDNDGYGLTLEWVIELSKIMDELLRIKRQLQAKE